MGEDLDHGLGDADPNTDMGWDIAGSGTGPFQESTVHGDCPDAVDFEKTIVIDIQRGFEENVPKDKTSPRVRFVTTSITHPTLVPTTSESQLEDANDDIATGFEIHKYKFQGVDDM
ncbi:hypothetical protein OBBRIDRAFT_832394 [Obba rivulosa]|uniref:Uncharacterized protein n=1 Tax=Obba rivulosa TaxID=1052685 RepID=A0A8E2DQA3_9APHY|nr:hypothetical protein OBBRIDRAFT_832394 [Obba rivulosa]